MSVHDRMDVEVERFNPGDGFAPNGSKFSVLAFYSASCAVYVSTM